MKLVPIRAILLFVAPTVFHAPAIAEDVCIRIFCDSKKTDKITNEARHGRFFTAILEPSRLSTPEVYTISKSDYKKAKEACYYMKYLGYLTGTYDNKNIWGQDASSYELTGKVIKISEELSIGERNPNKCQEREK